MRPIGRALRRSSGHSYLVVERPILELPKVAKGSIALDNVRTQRNRKLPLGLVAKRPRPCKNANVDYSGFIDVSGAGA